MKDVLIIGGNSDIGKALALKYSDAGYSLFLTSRNLDEIKEFANHLRIQNRVDVELFNLDILDYKSHRNFYNDLPRKPTGVIVSVGFLGDQEKAETNFKETETIIDTNFKGIVSLINIIVEDFEVNRRGFIVGISSVAGDRGRRKNYIYGAAKAAFTAYLSGLRNRLYHSKVHVLTVKPGFVFTKMTQALELPPLLTAKPDEVANSIFNAQQKNKNIIYSKPIWFWIMIVIRNIPEWIFKKLNV